VDTYWQSDGAQPHLISIQFSRKMAVREVALYLDFKLDESYTPKKLSIRAGSTVHDLKEVRVEHVVEPTGWVTIPLSDGGAGDGEVRALPADSPRGTHVNEGRVLAAHSVHCARSWCRSR